jgi:hypothetical protein
MPTKSATKPVKSIRMSEEYQDALNLLSAYESTSETALIEEALDLLVQNRALTYRRALGLPREAVAPTPETVHEFVPRIREAVRAALAGGMHAPSEDERVQRLQSARATEPIAG